MLDKKYLNDLLLEDKFKDAADYCSKFMGSEVDLLDVLCARSEALNGFGKYELSMLDADAAINLSPSCAVAFLNRGEALWGLLKLEEAVCNFEKAIALGANAHIRLGMLYAGMGFNEKAVALLTMAIEHDRENASAYEVRSRVYYDLNLANLGHEDIGIILLLYVNDSNSDFYREMTSFYSEIANTEDTDHEIYDAYAASSIDAMLIANGFINYMTSFVMSGEKKLIGVYVLEFYNEEKYVGQSVDFLKRLMSHQRTFDDIVGVYFKKIDYVNDLIDKENYFIELLERAGHRIRNLKQINFRSIFDDAHQRKWLAEVSYQHAMLQSVKCRKVNKDQISRFEKLKSMPCYQDFLRITSLYIINTIPNFSVGEYNYWCISCMPKFLIKDNWISRININSMPVFSIRLTDNFDLEVMFFVSMLPYCSYLRENGGFNGQFNGIPSLRFEIREPFDGADNEEITLHVNSRDFKNLIDNKIILQSMRMFNLRMMNKIGDTKTVRRTPSHNGLLAAAIEEYGQIMPHNSSSEVT
jgi:tetratricopeptide (TPR) repeat protein